jgi:hypothetical protein
MRFWAARKCERIRNWSAAENDIDLNAASVIGAVDRARSVRGVRAASVGV